VTDQGGTDRDQVRLRRAPKYPAFLFVGGVLGALAALILTSTRKVDPEVGFLQLFLFLSLFCVVGGMLIAGIAALTFDRVLSARAAVVDAQHTHVPQQAQPEEAQLAQPEEAQQAQSEEAAAGLTQQSPAADVPDTGAGR
jgi:hypothetical protein